MSKAVGTGRTDLIDEKSDIGQDKSDNRKTTNFF